MDRHHLHQTFEPLGRRPLPGCTAQAGHPGVGWGMRGLDWVWRGTGCPDGPLLTLAEGRSRALPAARGASAHQPPRYHQQKGKAEAGPAACRGACSHPHPHGDPSAAVSMGQQALRITAPSDSRHPSRDPCSDPLPSHDMLVTAWL